MTRFLSNALLGLGSGLVGAFALTAAHEALRKNTRVAPRMDVLGMRALKKGAELFGLKPPRGRALRRDAMIGDLITNAAWFALAAGGSRSRGAHLSRGLFLGLLAGVGALVLPPMLGLGNQPRAGNTVVQGETVGLYVLGGLAAAGAALIARSVQNRGVLAMARAAAEDARLGVNARNSGMIH